MEQNGDRGRNAIAQLSRETTASHQRLGRQLFDAGHVRLVESSETKVVAEVTGDQTRRVEFVFSLGDVSWRCSCRRGQDRFCKHAVAVGLALQNRDEHGSSG
jgi:uncharacterized Zn finger protein